MVDKYGILMIQLRLYIIEVRDGRKGTDKEYTYNRKKKKRH